MDFIFQIIIGSSLLITVLNGILMVLYHRYFIVPLFKLMSYQSVTAKEEVELPSFVVKKEFRKPLEGKALADLMDKIHNVI